MSGLPGSGLVRGLAVTLRTMLKRSVTEQYPDVKPELPPRSRGVIALFEENCTVCMLCARECPDWCIYIDSHKETIPAREEGARARTRNELDRFAIDFSLCMYCGICIEVCPFDALFWSPEFEYAAYDIAELTHEREQLREWMWTVPPPPALDPDAEPAKELGTAAGGGQPARAERPVRAERAPRERPTAAGVPAAEPRLPQPGDEVAAGVPPEVAAAAEADAASSVEAAAVERPEAAVGRPETEGADQPPPDEVGR